MGLTTISQVFSYLSETVMPHCHHRVRKHSSIFMDPAVICKPIEMKTCHEDLGLQI